MATTSTAVHTDWRGEWFEIEDATYLNLAGQSPMPKVSLRAIQSAIADKKYPHHRRDAVFYEIPNRIRSNIARLIGATPDEIAITTGASAGVTAVAYALDWKPGDEVITAAREFPLQYTIWRPMEERVGLKVRIVAPRDPGGARPAAAGARGARRRRHGGARLPRGTAPGRGAEHVPLDHQWIEQHIPHKGRMCLLDEVLSWDATRIRCRSASSGSGLATAYRTTSSSTRAPFRFHTA